MEQPKNSCNVCSNSKCVLKKIKITKLKDISPDVVELCISNLINEKKTLLICENCNKDLTNIRNFCKESKENIDILRLKWPRIQKKKDTLSGQFNALLKVIKKLTESQNMNIFETENKNIENEIENIVSNKKKMKQERLKHNEHLQSEQAEPKCTTKTKNISSEEHASSPQKIKNKVKKAKRINQTLDSIESNLKHNISTTSISSNEYSYNSLNPLDLLEVNYETSPENVKMNTSKNNRRTLAANSGPDIGTKPKYERFCPYCNKRLGSRSALSTHIRSHEDKSDHVCSTCNKSFTRKDHLQEHERSHMNYRPHICTVCGKCFTRANSLTKHMRIHDDNKPYICNICAKTFRQSGNLQKHLRLHKEKQASV